MRLALVIACTVIGTAAADPCGLHPIGAFRGGVAITKRTESGDDGKGTPLVGEVELGSWLSPRTELTAAGSSRQYGYTFNPAGDDLHGHVALARFGVRTRYHLDENIHIGGGAGIDWRQSITNGAEATTTAHMFEAMLGGTLARSGGFALQLEGGLGIGAAYTASAMLGLVYDGRAPACDAVRAPELPVEIAVRGGLAHGRVEGLDFPYEGPGRWFELEIARPLGHGISLAAVGATMWFDSTVSDYGQQTQVRIRHNRLGFRLRWTIEDRLSFAIGAGIANAHDEHDPVVNGFGGRYVDLQAALDLARVEHVAVQLVSEVSPSSLGESTLDTIDTAWLVGLAYR